jgi:hypothetical protein
MSRSHASLDTGGGGVAEASGTGRAEFPGIFLHGFDFFKRIDGKLHYMVRVTCRAYARGAAKGVARYVCRGRRRSWR